MQRSLLFLTCYIVYEYIVQIDSFSSPSILYIPEQKHVVGAVDVYLSLEDLLAI